MRDLAYFITNDFPPGQRRPLWGQKIQQYEIGLLLILQNESSKSERSEHEMISVTVAWGP